MLGNIKRSIGGGLAAVAAGLLLAGCASQPQTYSSADQSVDFRAYQTYGFMSELKTDGEDYQSIESTYLKNAVAREMEKRGFSKSAKPDLLVNFTIQAKEKVRSRSVPVAGVYGDPYWDYGYYGTAYQTRIDQYTEGHLNIVVLDPKEEKLVWQGSTRGRITAKLEQDMHGTLNDAVNEVFQQFPVAAPQVQQVSFELE